MIKRFLLKEYGSWTVVTATFLAAVVTGQWSDEYRVFFSALATAVFINSKQAFVIWLRTKEYSALWVFSLQILIMGLLLFLLKGGGFIGLVPVGIIPLLYVVLLWKAGEHALITELTGFAVLCLPSLVFSYLMGGPLNTELFLASWLFFSAGVLRVRVQLKKTLLFRVVMTVYPAVVAGVYFVIGFPLTVLLPLVENISYAIFLYNLRLKHTGWIELSKAVFFVLVLAFLR